ncbi:TAXI family TRAP transporter solute-binding subunit [Streptomyces sp. NPDC005963]|uniref:TAXI family TRAP transporter solute-binding subunit n=1 Tax=Streptomyces sp. NPDC005963 TaxID=3156721 RepID=UPI0034103CCD
MEELTEAVDIRILGAGQNWMDVSSLVAVGLAGYYSALPPGSTAAAISGNPGEMCMKAPQLVTDGQYHMAVTTPLWYLKMAIEGRGPFTEPLPLSVIAVFPHDDRLAFAVRRETGLKSLSDIRAQKYPLRLSMPTPEMLHPAGWVIEEILAQYGLTREDIESWGGEILRDRPQALNSPTEPPVDPSFDAVFDEAFMTRRWRRLAEAHDLRFLPVDDDVLSHCEALGMERGVIEKGRQRGVDDDVPTVDFSGWALFCRSDMSERIAYLTAAALDAKSAEISARFTGDFAAMTRPIELARLTDTSMPIHPGAAAYYREQLAAQAAQSSTS